MIPAASEPLDSSAMSRSSTIKALNKWSRKLHRIGAIAIALPLGVVIATGVLLQLKKDVAWIQPPMAESSGGDPWIDLPAILAAASSVPEARVSTWSDVDRLDVRPNSGVVKVRCKSRWEVQIDLATGEVLQVRYRRSDLIESIHDGSFFHDKAKLGIFLPAGVILLGLWISGIYLWVLPIVQKRRGKARRTANLARL